MPTRSFSRPLALSSTLAFAVLSCSGDSIVAPRMAPDGPNASLGPVTGSLVISEVMPDPSRVGDTAGEWFEVYNGTGVDVNLQGYRIVSAAGATASESHTIASSVPVAAGAYVVLGNNINTATNGGVTVAYSYAASITLNNGSSSTTTGANEWLAIRTAAGVTVDSVAYAVRATPTSIPGTYVPPSGASRGVIDLAADNTIISGSNWITSVTEYGAGDRGTPGTQNVGGAPASVTVRMSWVTPGTSFNVTALAVDAEGLPSVTTFTWASSDPAIATVNSLTGRVTGVSTGIVTITATAANNVSGNAPVFVVNPGDVASISISVNDPARVPVGFTKPAFPTTRTTDNVTVQPKLTWSSSKPEVASVDTLGYITGQGEGTALIRATAPNGVYNEVPFTVIAGTAPTSAVYKRHLEFGTPRDATPDDDFLLETKREFALSWNKSRGGPNWVSWNLNASQFGPVPRCDCFSADLALPAEFPRIVDFDYRNGGYDRGHMVQSESRTVTDQENAATFLLTNILPQAAANNQGPWLKLENYLNDLARKDGKEIYVVAGGQYAAEPQTLKGEQRVAIPDYTWKVAVVLDAGEGLESVKSTADVRVIAARFPNLTATHATIDNPAYAGTGTGSTTIYAKPWEEFATTVDAIEAATGYDVLSALPDNIENVVESNDKPPVAVATGPSATVEGTEIAFDASQSSDPDAGDVLTYAWDFGDGTTGEGVAPVHTYRDNGTYTATLTATDKFGASSQATVAVAVSNAAPAFATLTGPPAPVARGADALVSFTFTDAGAADTHTAIVDWNDGTTSPATVSAGSGTATHQYAAPGVYTVTVTLTDDDGASVSKQVEQYLVVYDPAAGFVVGGGWITSPAGAYAGTSSSGKATFGFVARYQRGATTPTGHTEFQFHAGGFEFSSTSYDWLVVAGAGRAQYKGKGVIAGREGTYDFILTAVDGDAPGGTGADRLRLKVTSGDQVIYDNQGGADDAEPSTAIGGGSITVQTR